MAEGVPTMLRKHPNDLKTNLFPALMHMLSEVLYENEIEEWKDHVEEELQARNDPSSVAADSINRIASFIGEKTIIGNTT